MSSSSHGGGESGRWLVSYADLITLMMALFLVLYSLGQTDLQKYRTLAESFRRAFSGAGAAVVDAQISQAPGAGVGEGEPSPVQVLDFPARPSDTVDVATDISSVLTGSGISSDVVVNNNAEGVLISISEQLLFQPGRADIQPSAQTVLDKLAAMLKTIPNDVRVVAHTDPTQPTDPRYPTNWDLSTARAVNIVRYLSEFGAVDPARLTAAGQAQYRPIYPNDTPENSAFNRRADIIIIYPLEQSSNVSGGIISPIQIPGIPSVP